MERKRGRPWEKNACSGWWREREKDLWAWGQAGGPGGVQADGGEGWRARTGFLASFRVRIEIVQVLLLLLWMLDVLLACLISPSSLVLCRTGRGGLELEET